MSLRHGRLKFGVFVAPQNRVGLNPNLAIRPSGWCCSTISPGGASCSGSVPGSCPPTPGRTASTPPSCGSAWNSHSTSSCGCSPARRSPTTPTGSGASRRSCLFQGADFADWEATLRSYRLIAEEVAPRLDGTLEPVRTSYDAVVGASEDNRNATAAARLAAQDQYQRERAQPAPGRTS